MAGPKNLRSASGGGAALLPAFAGSGLSEGRFCSELPRLVIYRIPVRSPCQAREVVRAKGVQSGHGDQRGRARAR
jgi:hypothetical protein